MSYRQRSETVSGYLKKLPNIDWDNLTEEEANLRLAQIRGQARSFYNMPIRSDDHIYEALEKKYLFDDLISLDKAARLMMMYGRSFEKMAVFDEVHHFKPIPSMRIPIIEDDSHSIYTHSYSEEAIQREKIMSRPSIRFKMEGAEIRKPPRKP